MDVGGLERVDHAFAVRVGCPQAATAIPPLPSRAPARPSKLPLAITTTTACQGVLQAVARTTRRTNAVRLLTYLYLDRETLERDIDGDALHAPASRASRSRAKTAASAHGGGRASPEPLLDQWRRRREKRAAARSRPATLPPFWEAFVGDTPAARSPEAIAFSEGVPPWAAQAVQHVTGRAFGAVAS